MSEPLFVPSALHVTANMVDITTDLNTPQTKTIGELLEEENQEKPQPTQCGREHISEHS